MMRVHAVVLGLTLLVTACAPQASQGPIQQPVPVPKRSTEDRSDYPPSPPRDRRPPVSEQRPSEVEAPPAPPVPSAPPPEAETAEEDSRPHELLSSILWVQTAVEYKASTLQAYRGARRSLERALEDPGWNALASEAPQPDDPRPPAVILDIDETVLDNSTFEGGMVRHGQPFSTAAFNRWCFEEQATAVPGALEFTRYADSRGVAVFYVTNRNHEVEEATRNNLAKLGFPLGPSEEDRVLTRFEREEWQSDKETRRTEVARTYRVVLLVGDDLNDFISGGRA
ncbi:MAG: hypothetical protein KDD47_04875, partial [Acidobacteria bacterium]|nr:hypothetical protein [Acidobacteriota bacterium]